MLCTYAGMSGLALVIYSVSSYLRSKLLRATCTCTCSPTADSMCFGNGHASPPDRMESYASIMPCSPRLLILRFGLARLMYGPLLLLHPRPHRFAPVDVRSLHTRFGGLVRSSAWESCFIPGNPCLFSEMHNQLIVAALHTTQASCASI